MAMTRRDAVSAGHDVAYLFLVAEDLRVEAEPVGRDVEVALEKDVPEEGTRAACEEPRKQRASSSVTCLGQRHRHAIITDATHTHTHTHARTHARAHAHTRARTHAHAHAHTHCGNCQAIDRHNVDNKRTNNSLFDRQSACPKMPLF